MITGMKIKAQWDQGTKRNRADHVSTFNSKMKFFVKKFTKEIVCFNNVNMMAMKFISYLSSYGVRISV